MIECTGIGASLSGVRPPLRALLNAVQKFCRIELRSVSHVRISNVSVPLACISLARCALSEFLKVDERTQAISRFFLRSRRRPFD